MATHLEIERKFELSDGAPDPISPVTVPGGARLVPGRPREHTLVATYFDTPDLHLLRHRISLRRRTGGPDEGWHLKTPAEQGRMEHHHPLTASTMLVPGALRREIAEVLGPRPVLPVAEIVTRRRETPLLDEDTEVVVLCDDRVTSRGPHGEDTWRELEAELVVAERGGGLGSSPLDAVTTHLLGLPGVAPATSGSKIARVLGTPPVAEELTADTPASHLLGVYLAAQVGALQDRAPGLAEDLPGAVHKSRVALRRLRSTLRVFRPLLDASITEPLRDELRWLAARFAPARDGEVLLSRLTDSADRHLPGLPADLLGPIGEQLPLALRERHARAHRQAVATLSTSRFLSIHESLVALVMAPPWQVTAHRPAADVLPGCLDRALRRVERAHAATEDDTHDATQTLYAWHEVRKKSKAMRYACEALAPAFPRAATAAARWEEVTETLGLVQDAAVAREVITELAHEAAERGEPTFGHGVLFGAESTDATALRAAAAEALQEARAHDLWAGSVS